MKHLSLCSAIYTLLAASAVISCGQAIGDRSDTDSVATATQAVSTNNAEQAIQGYYLSTGLNYLGVSTQDSASSVSYATAWGLPRTVAWTGATSNGGNHTLTLTFSSGTQTLTVSDSNVKTGAWISTTYNGVSFYLRYYNFQWFSYKAVVNTLSGGVTQTIQSYIYYTPTLTASGDIGTSNASGTASAIFNFPGPTAIVGDGDNADLGFSSTGANSFALTWGARGTWRFRPVPGNHDYPSNSLTLKDGALQADYTTYWNTNAYPANTYGSGANYTYRVGSWNIIALNSNCLRDDATNSGAGCSIPTISSTKCALAYMHQPRYSSGATHGSVANLDWVWRSLYASGVDIVLSGHNHIYERFNPMNADGSVVTSTQTSPAGMVQFGVGRGGMSGSSTVSAKLAQSVLYNNTTYGVLRLELMPDRANVYFVNTSSGTVDSTTVWCRQ